MALTTVKITGTFNFPDASWAANTQAEFMISGYDTDTDVVVPDVVKSTLSASGDLDVDLWGNDDGIRGTVYRVNVVLYSDAGLTREVKRIDLGKIQINGDGPLDIASLLDSPVSVPGAWYSTITEDEYNAAIQAVDDAQAWAESPTAPGDPGTKSSKTWAIDAAASAVLADARADDAASFAGYRDYQDVATLLANTSLAYGPGAQQVAAGDVIRTRAEGFSYEVAAADAVDAHVTTAGGVKLYVLPDAGGAHDPAAFGADVAAADNSAAIAAMYAAAPTAVRYNALYPVTGNFPRAAIPHYGTGGVTIGGVDIPLNTTFSYADMTVYYGATGSDISNHGLSGDYPFSSPQRAYDSLPAIIENKINIQASGASATFSASSQSATSQPRPALVRCSGKLTMYRTYKDGSTLSGGIVFSGDVADPTKYEWETSSEYPRGIYVENGNIGVAGMTIKGDGVNSATALVTSHRNRSYVHLLSCIVDGVDKAQTTYGLLAESGGLIEQGGVDVKNCGTLLSALGGASSISHTHDGTRGLLSGGDTAVGLGPGTFAALYMLQTGTGDVSVVSSNTIGANLAANSTLFLRGADASNHLVFGSLINTADSATLDCLFTSLDGATTVKNGDMRLSNSFYGRQITLKGGSRLRLVNAQGYLRGMSGSPAPDINKSTQSAIFTEGTLTSVSWAEPETTWTVTGDNETVSVSDGVDFYDLRGDSAAYVGCEIDATGVNEGREITVWGAGFPIEFLGGGSNMDIQSGSEFRLGNPAGFSNVYTGAKFKMASGRWRCVGLGAPR